MSKRRSTKPIHQLPLDTIIEIVATDGDQIVKKPMKFGDWLELKKKPGWKYSAYQMGFCSIKEKPKTKK